MPNIASSIFQQSKVLIFCVEFRELSRLTRDLSQAEKELENICKANAHNTSISVKMVEVVI